MKIPNYEWFYHHPSLPYFWWRPREWFNRFNWMRNASPSFAKFFCDWWENIMVFLAPWYHVRRQFIDTFVNKNCTKLLDCGRNFASVRTRTENVNYYSLKCGLYRATLYRSALVDKKTGEHHNAFLLGICAAFGGKVKIEDYEERTVKLFSGPCLTRSQCEHLLDRIVAATPDCEWFDERG